jgi:hypothetical protein
MLDCGSGGCGARLYVLAPDAGARGGVAAYLHEIQSLGWLSVASSPLGHRLGPRPPDGRPDRGATPLTILILGECGVVSSGVLRSLASM